MNPLRRHWYDQRLLSRVYRTTLREPTALEVRFEHVSPRKLQRRDDRDAQGWRGMVAWRARA